MRAVRIIVGLVALAVFALSACSVPPGTTTTTPSSSSVQANIDDGSAWDDYMGQMADDAMRAERQQRAKEACDAGIIEAC